MKIYKNGELLSGPEIIYTDTDEENDIFCMSNLRGKDIVIPHKMPFSFFFSEKESSHAIRVKPVFNPNKISKSSFGTLELHGDWKYKPGPDDKSVSKKQVNEMIQFFREYKVLFAGVWEGVLYDSAVLDYFRGIINFSDLLKEFDFYNKYKKEMDEIKDIVELEKFVRKHSIFNMWD